MIHLSEARKASVKRTTTETEIELDLDLDGSGNYDIDTGIGFFDHMLSLWARHGSFDLRLKAAGDLHVDQHHTVEDIGICMGRAIKQALGDKAGVNRYGDVIIPMDEALTMVAIDLSGRGYLSFDAKLPPGKVGDFDTELVEEFMRALVSNGEFTMHIRLMAGNNTHHIIESMFKALGRCLARAVSINSNASTVIPSTKGLL